MDVLEVAGGETPGGGKEGAVAISPPLVSLRTLPIDTVEELAAPAETLLFDIFAEESLEFDMELVPAEVLLLLTLLDLEGEFLPLLLDTS